MINSIKREIKNLTKPRLKQMPSLEALLRKVLQMLLHKQGSNAHQSLFQRYLSPGEAQLLAERISNAFGTCTSAGEVQHVAEALRYTEEQMVGRMAGDVDDYVLNYYMVCRSTHLSAAATPAHAEIGVLFGGGLLVMLRALRDSRSDHWALGIDPLDGYYGQNIDPVTGLPVILDDITANIKRLGFEMDRVRIVRARSGSREALRAAQAFWLASLWIDGDHSYHGIKGDWHNYSPLVIPGGYILIDNYHDGGFPGVDRFVDEDLLPSLAGWEVVASFSRSILFKKSS